MITLLFSYVVFSITIANVWFTLLGREDMALFNSTALVFHAVRSPQALNLKRSRHPWQLNESRFILIASNACLFLVAAARDILDDRLKADWPRERVIATLDSTNISLTNEICTETVCSSCQNRSFRQRLGI